MHSIGFKNFRRFKELKPLELSGVTFFVGSNNAGKSTVTKAMMLMMDNISHSLDYGRGTTPVFSLGSENVRDVHVGTFGRALHKPYPSVKEIEFVCDIEELSFRYILKGDVGSQRLNADINVFEISNKSQNWSLEINYAGTISISCPQSVLDRASGKGFARTGQIPDEAKVQAMLSHLDEELTKLKESLNYADEVRQAIIQREIKEKEAQKLALQAKYGGQRSSSTESIQYEKVLDFTSSDALHDHRLFPLLMRLYTEAKEQAFDLLETTKSSNTRSKCEDDIRQYDKILRWLEDTQREIETLTYKADIVYIPSHSVSQRVFFSREDRNDYMSEVVAKYQSRNYTDGSQQQLFVQNWMRKFGIGLGFRIDAIQGEAYTVTVTNMQGDDVPLADLGMGSIQIILLLLRLATLIEQSGRDTLLVIIEEPEQNIHPKLQSQLAELFESVHRKHGFRFLIETHSEYIIRKTQAMIANEKFKFTDNPFKVYYFPEDDEPYSMEYLPTGGFAKPFGPGFYDEASNLDMDVIIKEQEIKDFGF